MNDEPLLDAGFPEGADLLPSHLWELPESAARLRATLWHATERVQRRRRAVRRLRQAGVLVLLYALGVATARWWPVARLAPSPEEAASVASTDGASFPPVPVPDAAARTQLEEDLRAEGPATPEALERSARRSGARRPEQWREAGDLYLTRRSDVDAALRCYRHLLALLPDDRRSLPQEGDSWLLLALKRDLTQRSGP